MGQWARFSKVLFSFKIPLINEIIWDYEIRWHKMKHIHMNPLHLILCSLSVVKNKRWMDENMICENRERMSSSEKLPSRGETRKKKTQLEET